MSSVEKSDPCLAEDDDKAFREKRRLLKAAAAAPLVASLPTGPAWAMASASQCVIDSKQDTQESGNASLGYKFPNELDSLVRVKAKFHKYQSVSDPSVIVSVFELPGGELYLEDGTVFDPTGYNDLGAFDVYVLQIYEPDYIATGDPEAPNSVHNVGPWPKFQLSSTDGPNMGITGTCLCSVEPSFADGKTFV
jgi:hypothetical protein